MYPNRHCNRFNLLYLPLLKRYSMLRFQEHPSDHLSAAVEQSVVIMPARGGSKRIPGKNIKLSPLNGQTPKLRQHFCLGQIILCAFYHTSQNKKYCGLHWTYLVEFWIHIVM